MSNRPLPDSLLREGLAMLSAVVDDLLRATDCRVVTTLDCRLSQSIRSGLEAVIVDSMDDERVAFDRFASSSDVTLVIAPETDGVLQHRVHRIFEVGGRSANCSHEAIELCGDKLRLAAYLQSHGLRTIETCVANLEWDNPWDHTHGPCVLKPRDGAGSWLTFLLPRGDHVAWLNAVHEFRLAERTEQALLQPYIPGTPLSMGCLCHFDQMVELFPIGEQRFKEGTFQYQGGSIPSTICHDSQAKVEELIRNTCKTIPGLFGYIGFDLILPTDDPLSPVITEINPRLTTSFVGYRQLCRNNIAERWLKSVIGKESESTCLSWKPDRIRFGADGTWERHENATSL